MKSWLKPCGNRRRCQNIHPCVSQKIRLLQCSVRELNVIFKIHVYIKRIVYDSILRISNKSIFKFRNADCVPSKISSIWRFECSSRGNDAKCTTNWVAYFREQTSMTPNINYNPRNDSIAANLEGERLITKLLATGEIKRETNSFSLPPPLALKGFCVYLTCKLRKLLENFSARNTAVGCASACSFLYLL